MSDKYADIPLINNTETRRFEMLVEGAVSFIQYKQHAHTITLLHTEVPQALEGRGIAASLVEKTLHYLEDNHFKLISLCPYVTMYLKRHPEWNRIVEQPL
ncbi:MAG: GNAT family N-acetyltransferase [Agriterribacter sp.]